MITSNSDELQSVPQLFGQHIGHFLYPFRSGFSINPTQTIISPFQGLCHISLCIRLEGDHYDRERCDPTQVQPSSRLQSDFSEQKNTGNFSSRSAPPPICPLFPFLSLRRTPAPPSSDHLLNSCPWTWAVCKGTFQKRFSKFCFLKGSPPPPLTDNHCAQKSLAERGGSPPPFNRQNLLSSFWQAP